MKIAILTQPLLNNYGGLLQAYALQKVVRELGHDVATDRHGARGTLTCSELAIRFIHYCIQKYLRGSKLHNPFRFLPNQYKKHLANIKVISVNCDTFTDKYIKVIDFFEGAKTPRHEVFSQFDALIVGSDQIWRPAYSNVAAYFLDFAQDANIKKISYAASFGKDTVDEFKPHLLQKCAKSLKYFHAISVREDSGAILCKKHFGCEATHVPDPTLLLEKEDYIQLIEDEDQEELPNVLMAYVLDESPEKQTIINTLAKELNLSPLKVMPKQELTPESTDINDCIYPSVSSWLRGFRDAQFVITDSFHGTVFAIIFNKPFLSIVNKNRGASRFYSLLKIFNLENRIIRDQKELQERMHQPINFEQVNTIRKQWQKLGKLFLSQNLT
ncbi:MAG: polysaccharide pyruvyl transferase family protein [Rikenellaceae bacterium]